MKNCYLLTKGNNQPKFVIVDFEQLHEIPYDYLKKNKNNLLSNNEKFKQCFQFIFTNWENNPEIKGGDTRYFSVNRQKRFIKLNGVANTKEKSPKMKMVCIAIVTSDKTDKDTSKRLGIIIINANGNVLFITPEEYKQLKSQTVFWNLNDSFYIQALAGENLPIIFSEKTEVENKKLEEKPVIDEIPKGEDLSDVLEKYQQKAKAFKEKSTGKKCIGVFISAEKHPECFIINSKSERVIVNTKETNNKGNVILAYIVENSPDFKNEFVVSKDELDAKYEIWKDETKNIDNKDLIIDLVEYFKEQALIQRSDLMHKEDGNGNIARYIKLPNEVKGQFNGKVIDNSTIPYIIYTLQKETKLVAERITVASEEEFNLLFNKISIGTPEKYKLSDDIFGEEIEFYKRKGKNYSKLFSDKWDKDKIELTVIPFDKEKRTLIEKNIDYVELNIDEEGYYCICSKLNKEEYIEKGFDKKTKEELAKEEIEYNSGYYYKALHTGQILNFKVAEHSSICGEHTRLEIISSEELAEYKKLDEEYKKAKEEYENQDIVEKEQEIRKENVSNSNNETFVLPNSEILDSIRAEYMNNPLQKSEIIRKLKNANTADEDIEVLISVWDKELKLKQERIDELFGKINKDEIRKEYKQSLSFIGPYLNSFVSAVAADYNVTIEEIEDIFNYFREEKV